MTRPTILDLDLVVAPREATMEMQVAGNFNHDQSPEAVFSAMLSASPYPAAWDDVRKYVEGLEERVAFTMTDTSRMLRKSDIKDVCPHPDDCFEISDRVRCGPCASAASLLAGIKIDDTHSHLPEVCRLRREVRATNARIAEIEKRLADAERVIEPFAEEAACYDPDSGDGDDILWATPAYFKIRHLRAARAYMEGK